MPETANIQLGRSYPQVHIPASWLDDDRLSDAAFGLLVRLDAATQRSGHATAPATARPLVDELARAGYISSDGGAIVDPFEPPEFRRLWTSSIPTQRAETVDERCARTGSVVYYVQHCDGLVKIGWSVQFAVRIKALRRQFDGAVEVLAVEPGDGPRERQRHRQFAHLRVVDLPGWWGTEWFRPGADLMGHVASLAVQ